MEKRLIGLSLIVAWTIVACSGPGLLAPQGVNEGDTARDFTLETLDGDQVSLGDYKGSVVLINFWATWCPPCTAEMPDLEAAYREHKDKGFVVLGVNFEEPHKMVQLFVDDFAITYPILLDEKGKVTQDYRARGLPTSVFVDRDGVIQVRHMGYLSAGQLGDHLASFLSEGE